MFQFTGFASRKTEYHTFSMVGCPIRKSADYLVFANHRSLSQLVTSFLASESLGILHTLLVTFSLVTLVFLVTLVVNFILLLFHHVKELLFFRLRDF